MRNRLLVLVVALLACSVIVPAGAAPPPAFLSYPRSPAVVISGGSNVVISGKSFVGLTGKVAIEVDGAHNVYVHDVDFSGDGGDIYLVDCTGQIRIETIRAKNTGSNAPHHAGDGSEGSGLYNVIQLSRTFDDGTGGIRHVWAKGGDTEDMISIYKSGGTDATHPLVIEDVHLASPDTSTPQLQAWGSDSGTGINLADGGGHDIVLRNSTIKTAGQVGVQLNEPTRVVVTGVTVYGSPRALSNVGISQYGPTCATCTDNRVNGNRIYWRAANGSENDLYKSGHATVDWTGNTTHDTTIDPKSLQVIF